MAADGPPSDHVDDPDNRIDEAFAYFALCVEEYLTGADEEDSPPTVTDTANESVVLSRASWDKTSTEPEASAAPDTARAAEVAERAERLRITLCDLLKVVSITLDSDDNAQVIFEALNARGTPLLALDLVKNAVFHLASRQLADTDGLYEDVWRPQLDDDYLRASKSPEALFFKRLAALDAGTVMPRSRGDAWLPCFDSSERPVCAARVTSSGKGPLGARIRKDAAMKRALAESERDAVAPRFRRSGASEAVLVITAVADAVLALGAFVLSFDALRELAVVAGIRPTLAWIWPVIVDGFIVVATINAIVLSRRNARTAWYPWAALLVFALVSVLGNGLHAARHAHTELISTGVAAAVSAIPAVALLVISHLIVVVLMTHRDSPMPSVDHLELSDVGVIETEGRTARAGQARELPRPRHVPTRTQRDDHALATWVRSEIAQGRQVTGSDVARHLGLSPATGRRRLSAIRDRHPDLASALSR